MSTQQYGWIRVLIGACSGENRSENPKMGRKSSRHVMLALASPGKIEPDVAEKITGLITALDAELELFHCIVDIEVARPGRFAAGGVQKDISSFVAERQHQLERVAEEFRARGLRVRTSIRWDYPIHEGIVRQVLCHEPSLLIAHSVSKGAVTRALFSGTDYKLIETCPCPVLFMKTARAYSKAMLVAAVDPERTHDKPDVLDEQILKTATMLRDSLSAQLQILHVETPWEDVVRTTPELRNVPDVEKNDVYSAYHNTIEEKVLGMTRRYDIADKEVRIVEGDLGEVLPRYVNREMAGIVILGSVGRSWLQRALVGHTAERVLDAVHSDVLVVKPPGFRSRVSRQSVHHVEQGALPQGRLIW